MDIAIVVLLIGGIVLIGIWVVRSAKADASLDKMAGRIDEMADRAEDVGERREAELRQTARAAIAAWAKAGDRARRG